MTEEFFDEEFDLDGYVKGLLDLEDSALAVPYELEPDPLLSIQQWERSHHADLPELSEDAIRGELLSLVPRACELPAGHWARERMSKLAEELENRRSSKAQDDAHQPQQAPPQHVRRADI